MKHMTQHIKEVSHEKLNFVGTSWLSGNLIVKTFHRLYYWNASGISKNH